MTPLELTTLPSHDLVTVPSGTLEAIGQVANGYAAKSSFGRYQERKADNTLRAQRAALALFGDFLTEARVTTGGQDLADNPHSWRGVTWGLVDAFVLWMIGRGYAMGTVNGRLSAVKTYAKLATKADVLTPAELTMIRSVEGYSRTEGKRVDDRREVSRVGDKKAEAVSLTPQQVKRLKKQPNTPQGRRDALIVAILADHGLRVGELAGLQVTDVNLEAGQLTFYRPKVDRTQTHELTHDAKRALAAYFDHGDAPAMGALLRASTTTGGVQLTHAGMSERSITERVRYLGELIGVHGLSAHDLRHSWATMAARSGTPIDRLRDAGGWSSLAMPLRYVEAAKIANEGVRLE